MTKRHKRVTMTVLCLAIGIGVAVSLNSGYKTIPYPAILESFLSPDTAAYSVVIQQIRMPRIVLSLLCGAGLALSGCILQTITKNPLADPGILGINAGAGFAIMIFVAFFPALHLATMLYLPLFALVGGLAVAGFLYFFATKHGRLQTDYLLLGGIGASAAFSALMIVVGSDMESSAYQQVSRWLAGNLWGSNWYHVLTLLPYLLIFVSFAASRTKVMDVLSLGEEAAQSLGAQVKRERGLLLIAAVGLAASCIAVSGGISFVGLVAPHIARQLIGPRHAHLVPASMLIGGLFLLMADTVGRSLFQPIEIPAGIVVSILAAPYFLFLLRNRS